MATPRRSVRSQNIAPSYKEPEEVEADSGEESDLEQPTSSNKKSQSAKKNVRKSREEAPPSSSKKKAATGAPILSSSDSLFDIIRNKPNAIPMATVQWWEEESSNKEKSVSRLVNMLLQACGCVELLPLDTFSEDRDVDEEVRKIETGQTVKSQLSAKDKQGKKLRPNMSEFWRKLVANASDENILEINDHPLLRWLFALSTSQLKDVRFGACLAAMEMLMSLLDRANEVLDSVNKLDRLVQAGGAAKSRNKEQLQGRHQLKMALENFMDQLFSSVFVHRHRDVDAEIRARCIVSLGQCVAKYKTKFFDNSYLKYLGWSLNDKEYVVRLAAVEALTVLYETHQVTELEMFTNRFCSRLVEMRLDVNNEVAGAALRLLTIMARQKLLGQEHCEAVYKMLVENAHNVRSAAASFIEVAYLDGVLAPLYDEEVSKGRSIDRNEMLIKGLIEMITSVLGSEIGDSAVHNIVEALLPHAPILQDWTLICNILLEDDGAGEDSLAPEDKAMLSKFLVAALKIAKDDPRTENRSKVKGKKGGPCGLAEGSLYISTVLADLLKKFSADSQTVKALVQIPAYMDLSVLTNRQSKGMKDAVDLLVDIANKGQDSELLTSCAESFQILIRSECVLKEFIIGTVDVFLDSVRSELQKVLETVLKSSRCTAAQAMKLKRTIVLASNLDLFAGHDELVELLGKVLKQLAADSDANFSVTAGKYFVVLASQAVLWRSKELFESQDKENKSISPKAVVELRDFVLESLVEVSSSGLASGVRLQAVLSMSDIVQVYGKRQESRQWSDTMVKQLGCDLNPEILKAAEPIVRQMLSEEIEDSEALQETLSMEALDFDQQDPTGINKALVLTLFKFVLYHGSDEDKIPELVATALLHIPYNVEYYRQLFQILTRKIEDWRTWLLCHQKIYERILLKAQAKEDVAELTSHMIDAVGNTPLHLGSVQGYLLEAFQWALKGMPRTLGFLDVVSLHIKSLSAAQARIILDNISDLCSKRRINLTIKDSSPIQNIISFQKKIQDHLRSLAARTDSSTALMKSPESSKRSRSARGYDGADDVSSPRSGILETPISSIAAFDKDGSEAMSGDEDEAPTQQSSRSVASASKGKKAMLLSGRKATAKGKQKRKIEDEEDEDGFVSVKRSK